MLLLLVGGGGAEQGARAESVPHLRAGGDIIVVKRPNVTAYEEVTEEFIDRCRVPARRVTLDDSNAASLRASLKASDVVVAIGQRAVDAVAGSPARVVSALAFTVPPGVVPADTLPPPELTLRALKRARPSIRRVGVVYGPATEAMVRNARELASSLGLILIGARATDGPSAVRELHKIAAHVDALWLAPDLDVLTLQLFHYALTLEIKRGIPIAGATRQQVHSGALLAYDADPHAIGRQAADLANRLLEGSPPQSLIDASHTGNVELTVNGDVARRLGVDLAALRQLEARVE